MQKTFSRTGQQWLADKNAGIVHNLHNETKECGIHDILAAGNAVAFIPDRYEQAVYEGMKPCPHCIGADETGEEADAPNEA